MSLPETSRSVTYLLPIKAASPPTDELTDYLRRIAAICPVIVVDGSDGSTFDAAHRAWASFAHHVPPAAEHQCLNGKVHGVLTGLDLVETQAVVVADDDVRYEPEVLAACVAALDDADLVRPQNYFDPLPWHARWDTARTLLNRALGADFPGTLVVRAEALRAAGGYDGDVLFENLEMMRSIAAAGGRCVSRPDLYVRRIPPHTRHFVGQRVRQAYDEFARPHRLVLSMMVVPGVAALAVRANWRALVAGATASVLLAEVGRARCAGRRRFPFTSSLLAPAWILERGVCSWLAVGRRLTGGVPYAGGKLVRAANPTRALRRDRTTIRQSRPSQLSTGTRSAAAAVASEALLVAS
ncbi:MAG: glycosyltransferase [Actinobacteria bacterium]|nr:glycosyltransferase [Actinomycetota bacterium]